MDDSISKLSEIRSDYNCFSADEEPYYRALSEAIKILSQRADGDTISRTAAIDTEGLDEEVRCAMCRNQMKTDRGCDGNCKYDEKLYEKIMQIFYERIKPFPSAHPELCEDAVNRQRLLSDLKELIAAWKKHPVMAEQIKGVETAIGYVESIPSVKPNSKELSETHKVLDTISRTAAIDEVKRLYDFACENWRETRLSANTMINALRDLPPAQPTLHGYNIDHLELIARVLQKEDLPPERIVEALTDIGRIVAIVKDEFEEALRKAVEQCTM